ncbi:MAG: DEAD/DEAH box helicase [Promethearchaeota archaeon]
MTNAETPRSKKKQKFRREKTHAPRGGGSKPKKSVPTGPTFEDYEISEPTRRALGEQGITHPTDIQREAIPILMRGENFLGQAQTGSGKTLAFAIPVIERMDYGKLEALVLVPTRELCKQVASVFRDAGKYHGIKVVEVYGGVSLENQANKIRKGVNVVVATPGRLIDIYKRRLVDLRTLQYIILDEADRMLDMGFLPDIEYILNFSGSKDRQVMLFSATLLDEIKKLVHRFTSKPPVEVNVSEDNLTVESTSQFYYMVGDYRRKYNVLVDVLKQEKPRHVLVFTNTKRQSGNLEDRLKKEKRLVVKGKPLFKVFCLHGDMSQAARERVIRDFKQHKINLLIATDVASRGLDIPDVSHVINFDVPKFEEDYVHRIGRTSRMSKVGTAITLVANDEYVYLCRIEGFIGTEIRKKQLRRGDRGGPRRGGMAYNRGGEQSTRRRSPFH